MKQIAMKRKPTFWLFFLWLEIAVFLALIYTIIYFHCFRISPMITEAIFTFVIHLVYSFVAVTLLFGLLYCDYYSKKQIKELKQEIEDQLIISAFRTKRRIHELREHEE